MKKNIKSVIYNFKKLFIVKNIGFILIIIIVTLLIVTLFRNIHMQNIQYQKLNEESKSKFEQQSESKQDNKIISDLKKSETNEQKQEVEHDYRGDILMVF